MAKPKHTNLFITATTVLVLGACAQGSGLPPNTTAMNAQTQTGTAQANGKAVSPQKAFNRFPDIPVPSGANMDVERTIVFGSGESWFGQIGLTTGHGPNSMFDFYKQELSGFGWQEITSVRAPVSVLTYERQSRVLSIQVEKGTLGGTKVTLTVSPRGSAPVMN